MKLRIILALIILALILGIPLAFAQAPNFPQVMPPNTVYGRSAIGPGPGQAIPFATLMGMLTNSMPSTCSNIGLFGGKGDGATDNVAAFNTAILTAKCIYFPAGKYVFNSTPAAWNTTSGSDSLVMKGDGADATELFFPSVGTGFVINLQSARNSFHLRDFSLTTGQNGAPGQAIRVTQNGSNQFPGFDAPSDISNVTVRGEDGYFNGGVNYWLTGVAIQNVSNVNWHNSTIQGPEGVGALGMNGFVTVGNAIVIQGTFAGGTCTTFPVAHNFNGVYINQYGGGVVVGECVQGLAFSTCNFTGGARGVVVPAGLHGLTELLIANCQFNEAVSDIEIESQIYNVTISGNTFYMTDPLGMGNAGVWLNAPVVGTPPSVGSFIVSGNNFNAIGSGANNGIVLNEDMTTGQYGVISGNVFYGFNVTNSTGLFLNTGSKFAFVTGNSFSSLTRNIVNSGANNFIYGNFPEFLYTIAGVNALTCNATSRGRVVQLSDATSTAAASYNTTMAAAGGSTAVNVPVICNGTNWTYH